MNKKVLLRGFVCGNLGDDLFFHIIVNRYPNTNFYLIGKKQYEKYYSSYANLTYIPYDNSLISKLYSLRNKMFSLYNKINEKCFNSFLPLIPFITYEDKIILKVGKEVDENVLISGSMFIDRYSNLSSLKNRLNYEKQYFDLKPYVLGINFGPYQHNLFYTEIKKYFENAKIVSFREEYSYELFKGSNMRVCPDIVFSMNVESKKKDKILINIMNIDKDNNPLRRYSKEYLSKLVDFINYLHNKNENIVLLSMCENQGDNIVVNEIKKQLSFDIETYEYPQKSINEIIRLFEESKMVIATRYHGMILGWMTKAKTLPIIYSNKMLNVLNDIDSKHPYVLLEDIGNINLSNYYDKMNNELDIESIQKKAAIHFKELDQILN